MKAKATDRLRKYEIANNLMELIEAGEEYSVAELLLTVVRRQKDPRKSDQSKDNYDIEISDKELYETIYDREMDDTVVQENIKKMIKSINENK